MNLFELSAKISLDTKEYLSRLDGASNKTHNFASKLGGGLKKAAKIGAAGLAAVGAAATATAVATGKAITKTAQYADNIDKMSQKMGLSAEAYQEWDFIMEHSGTSMESLKAGMKTLANAVDTGNEAFSRLGINQEKIASMSQEELFEETIRQLQQVDNETERTYLAGQLLGRGATELGALLNTTAEDTEAMRKQVHELGGVLSDEAVKAGAAFQDSLQNLRVAGGGLTKQLSAEFLPSITSVMDGLSALITGDDSGFALIEQGIDDFVTNLNEKVPKFVETATKIVVSFAGAIVENLPTLIDGALQMIQSLAMGISENQDQIVDGAVETILTLADGLVEMAPELITTALTLMGKLAVGLIEAIPELIAKVPEIIEALVQEFIEHKDEYKDIGANIVSALWQGLKDTWHLIADWFTEKWNALFHKDVVVNGSSKSIGGSGTDGSHAGGLDYVPYNNYIARLHKGERVLTAGENETYNKGNSGVNVVQNIYSQVKTAADLMQEAMYQQEKAVYLGV